MLRVGEGVGLELGVRQPRRSDGGVGRLEATCLQARNEEKTVKLQSSLL